METLVQFFNNNVEMVLFSSILLIIGIILGRGFRPKKEDICALPSEVVAKLALEQIGKSLVSSDTQQEFLDKCDRARDNYRTLINAQADLKNPPVKK